MRTVGVFAMIFSFVVVWYVGALLVNEFEGVITDSMSTETSSRFNSTAEAVVENTWTSMQLLALGILILGVVYILRTSGLLTPAPTRQPSYY